MYHDAHRNRIPRARGAADLDPIPYKLPEPEARELMPFEADEHFPHGGDIPIPWPPRRVAYPDPEHATQPAPAEAATDVDDPDGSHAAAIRPFVGIVTAVVSVAIVAALAAVVWRVAQ